MTDPSLEPILDDFRKGLTLDGAKRVFEDSMELVSENLLHRAKPEEYTKIRVIRPLLELLGCKLDDAERIFVGPRGIKREIDYTFTSKAGLRYFLEAKAMNADLFADKPDSGVNQTLDALKLHDVVKEFDFGIASDGIRWVLINTDRKIVADIDVREDMGTLRSIFHGEIRPEFDREGISRKFYRWYSALLYGGKYEDHEGRSRSIAKKDSLVESIQNVEDEADREHIAQAVMDRLIFIRFLESKRIIRDSIIEYMQSLPDNAVNPEMKSLFFQVMNTDPTHRGPVSEAFKDIPYLNGSLFIRNSSEMKFSSFSDYWISVPILREVFRFLDSFTFTNKSGDSMESLDPEILGYIFEMSMVSKDRKGTGAFYTPREITIFMSREAIHSCFVSKVKDYLRSKGYPEPDVDLIRTVDDVYNLSDIRLADIFGNVLRHIRVCDNACGSGAFLLAAADVLFDIYYNVNAKSGLSNTEVAMKKLILAHNIFGVDLNANAVEIAKLRMWLWVVDSYKPGFVEALPNIDYNVVAGDSLIGYVSIRDKLSTTITLDDYGADEATVEVLLKEKESLIARYRSQSGNEARASKLKIDNINRRISGKLSMAVYGAHADDIKCSSMEFFALTPFHWGLEFSEVFEEGGFDVILGNPPYIQLQKMRGLSKSYYEKTGFKVFSNSGDIYFLFYERSNQLLKDGGILTYITSNSWMKIDAGIKLRNYFIQCTEPVMLIDITDIQIFKDATVECGILSYNKISIDESRLKTDVKVCTLGLSDDLAQIEGIVRNESILTSFEVDKSWIVAEPFETSIIQSVAKNGVTLKDLGVKINRGITTGCNPVFVLDENVKAKLEVDPRSSELIRPVLGGRDIRKFKTPSSGHWLLTTHNGDKKRGIPPVDVNDYPEVKRYLDQYYDELEKRQDKGSTPYNLRNCAYMEDFDKTKIAWIDLTDMGRFSIVEPGVMFTDSVFFMVCEEPNYLLGVLNSSVVTWYFGHICATSGAGTNRWKKQFVEQIPIPVNPPNRAVIEELVSRMIGNPEDKVIAKALDIEVCKAYGLNEDEMKYILESN